MIRFVVAAALIAAPAAAQTNGLARVQAHLRGLTTMTAAFAQTDRNGRTLTGTLTLKQPGKIRFQYEKGVPLLIVGDGKALTMIDYQVAQVSRWPVGNSPLSLLLDPSKDIARYAHLVPGMPDGRIALTYGNRDAPYTIDARISSDGGRSWSAARHLRRDGGNHDARRKCEGAAGAMAKLAGEEAEHGR